ncbi:MAG: DegT/DnrJ/EryC1/StrS family aminotransferase [Candidatus Omnitrophota bacterium]|jgi:dTDP-4-amino-4,6-dideoxygalactose transaminase
MKIPAIDMRAQIAPIRREIDKAIGDVIDRGSFILGEDVKALEQDIINYTSANFAVGVSNGTDAITLSLEALGIGQGDCVLCPAFTYYATASAVIHAGAKPVFIDIDPKTYCISAEALEAYLKKNSRGHNIKAVVPVHLYGQCADMGPIIKLAERNGLKVIEDAAQAFGADHILAGRVNKAGVMGDCGSISFFPGKNLGAFGDAGMILTRDRNTSEKLFRLRNQGSDAVNKYRHIYIGRNNRLDAIQAAILRVKLRYIDSWNKKRSQNALYYNEGLKATPLTLPHVSETNTHIYHQYTLRAKNNIMRDKVINHLQAMGVDSRVFYPIPLHLQPCFSYLGYNRGCLPESENAAGQVFTLPVYPELTRQQMDYIIDSIKRIL